MRLTIDQIKSMESEEFKKLYIARVEEMRKSVNKGYDSEEREDMLKLLDSKSEELSKFLNDETIETWSEIFEGVEKRLEDMIKIFEMALLAEENHSRAVRFVFGFLKDNFKEEIQIKDNSEINE